MKQSIWWLAGGLFLLLSCNKPTTLGSDLLDQDQIPTFFTDTFSILAQTVPTDSIKTFDPTLGAQNGYLLGNFQDPIFGRSAARILFQVRLNFETPDFSNAVVDSMVLSIPFRGSLAYGDLTQPFEVTLHTLADEVDPTVNIYSNQVFNTDQLIHNGNLFFAPGDSLDLLVYGKDDGSTTKVPPQARFRLDQAFAEGLINQPADVLSNDTSFLKVYPGFLLAATSDNPGMMCLDLRTSAQAKIDVYYRVVDTIFEQYTFPINGFSVKAATFEHDYAGAPIEPFIGSGQSDSLLFLQGMAGVRIDLEFPTIESMRGKIVNRAELLLPITFLDGDDEALYPAADQLILSEITEEGELEVIQDVIFAITREDLDGLFGGVPEAGPPAVYRLNLTSHIQDMKEGLRGKKLALTIFSRFEKASRVVLHGPNHPENPSKLRLYFSEY